MCVEHRENRDPCNLSVCVVDADEACRVYSVATAESVNAVDESMCRAEGAIRLVAAFQAAGRRVIVLSSGGGAAIGPLRCDARVEGAKLLHVQGPGGHQSVVEVAEEYRCAFALSVGESDAYKARCSVPGCSRVTWNGQSGEQCCRTCRKSKGLSHGEICDSSETLARAIVEADAKSFLLVSEEPPEPEPWHRIRQLSQEWLRRVRSDLWLRYSFDSNGVVSLIDPPSAQRSSRAKSRKNSSDEEGQVVIGILTVRRSRRTEHLLCIRCDGAQGPFFQAAARLCAGAICEGASSLCEDDGNNVALNEALASQDSAWHKETLLLAVCSGRHTGLRAVGVGFNLQKRRRAARLALAITVAFHAGIHSSAVDSEDADAHASESPSGTHLLPWAEEFADQVAELALTAKRLYSSVVVSSSDDAQLLPLTAA